jgi:four helix bundle protein
MLTHKDLKVWQKSIDFVVEIYEATSTFPKEEIYGLTSQIRRRASVSVQSNIDEGYGRFSDKELIRFLFISLGSASEVETQLIICNRLNYLKEIDFNHLSQFNNEIIKMLAGLIRSKNNGSIKNPDSDDIAIK